MSVDSISKLQPPMEPLTPATLTPKEAAGVYAKFDLLQIAHEIMKSLQKHQHDLKQKNQ